MLFFYHILFYPTIPVICSRKGESLGGNITPSVDDFVDTSPDTVCGLQGEGYRANQLPFVFTFYLSRQSGPLAKRAYSIEVGYKARAYREKHSTEV